MRFIELAKRTYTNLNIEIERNARRMILHGPLDQVNVCKTYFESILNNIIHRHYKIGKEMAVFLSNPDTGRFETLINNFLRKLIFQFQSKSLLIILHVPITFVRMKSNV